MRRYPRLPTHFDVEYTQAGMTSHGTCLNLSQQGMFIATQQPRPLGTELSLRFTPPGSSTPLSVRARVVWMCEQATEASSIVGMGVQFLVYLLISDKTARGR